MKKRRPLAVKLLKAQEDFLRSLPEERPMTWMVGAPATYWPFPVVFMGLSIPVSEETFRDLTKKRRRR